MTETEQLCRLVLVLLLVLTSTQSAWAAGPESGLDALRKLLIERLALMEQVAAYKWNQRLPIEDPAREANVLNATLARSRAAGLDDGLARRFIVAQMEAAKFVQRYYFETWRKEGVETIADVPDLKTNLRPRIGALSADLIVSVAESRSQLAACPAVSILMPVPEKLLRVPRAWAIAVKGVLGEQMVCS